METQSEALSPVSTGLHSLPISAVSALVDSIDKGLLISERSGKILMANLRGRECLASLGYPNCVEINLFQDLLKSSSEDFVRKIKPEAKDVRLQIVSASNKFL